jgi:hypothetical protein
VSSPWIELYFDEDVDPLLGKLIRARGYVYKTTPEAEMIGSTDAAQLAFAFKEARTIITHNRAHFEQLAADYFASGRTHWGIVIAVRRPPHLLARRLLVVLGATSRASMKNQLVYI